MQKINHLSEFEHGKKYKRVSRGVHERIVEVRIIKGIQYANDLNGEEWMINLGYDADYYPISDVLSSSEEL